jgi:polyhydroxybutyrate depolymerase
MKNWRTELFLIALVLIWPPAMPSAEARDAKTSASAQTITLEHDGLQRTYELYIPKNLRADDAHPLVIMLHGGGGTGRYVMRQTGWPAKADVAGFIVALPDGTRANMAKPAAFVGNAQVWNNGSGIGKESASTADDVGFIRAMIDDIEHRAAVDAKRIYVTGHSNGSGMAFRVGVELADQVAAIAPVEGYLWFTPERLTRPVPLFLIGGADDPVNPPHGGKPKVNAGRRKNLVLPSMHDNFATWAKLLGCRDTTSPQDSADGVHVTHARGCDGNAEAQFVIIDGQGHSWPGGYEIFPAFIVGPSTKTYRATDAIWEFFSRQRLR